MSEPTKVVERYQVDSGFDEKTYEHLCSVELGATAKGEPQIKSVKAYGATIDDASQDALRVFLDLREALGLIQLREGGDNGS